MATTWNLTTSNQPVIADDLTMSYGRLVNGDSAGPYSSSSRGTVLGGHTDTGKTVIVEASTPGYFKMIEAEALIPFTPRRVTRSVIQHFPCYYTPLGPVYSSSGPSGPDFPGRYYTGYESCNPYYGMQGCFAGLSLVRATVPDDVSELYDYSYLLQEAAAKARSGALLAMVELAEMPETIALGREFLSKTQKRVNHVARDAHSKHPKLKKLSDVKKAFDDTWMEGRYGWSQMVYSFEDIDEAIRRLAGGDIQVVKGKASETIYSPGTVDQISTRTEFSRADLTFTKQECGRNVVHRAVVQCQVKRAKAAVDFNVGTLVHELIPYSWIYDKFVNIGDFLAAHVPQPGISGQVACTSRKIEERLDIEYEGSSSCGTTALPGRSHYQRLYYEREPWLEDIPIDFSFHNRATWKTWVDLSAVLGKYPVRVFKKLWKLKNVNYNIYTE